MFLYLFQIWMATLLTLMPKQSNEICSQTNTAFNSGEKITYTIFYNVIGLYVHAGDAQFAVSPSKWEGEPALALTATGNSNRRYDWIFKVRDKYESIVDSKIYYLIILVEASMRDLFIKIKTLDSIKKRIMWSPKKGSPIKLQIALLM